MSENITTGVIRTYYDTEKTKLKKEYFVCNGKKQGIYKSYWYNGQLGCEVNYIDNKRNGIFKSYRKNGQLYEEVNYTNGMKHGIFKSYWYNGKFYEDGELD